MIIIKTNDYFIFYSIYFIKKIFNEVVFEKYSSFTYHFKVIKL